VPIRGRHIPGRWGNHEIAAGVRPREGLRPPHEARNQLRAPQAAERKHAPRRKMLASRRFANNPPAIPRCSSPQRSDSTELAARHHRYTPVPVRAPQGAARIRAVENQETILAGAAGVAVAEFRPLLHPSSAGLGFARARPGGPDHAFLESFVRHGIRCAAAVAVAARPVFAATTTLTHPTFSRGAGR